MRRELTAAAIGLSAAVLLSNPGSAAQAPTAENFAKTVAMSDMFEIQSGQLAADKSENDDVQSFGKQMADDHTETSEDLKELIEDEEIKVELPSKLDDEHQTKLDKLKGLSGTRFDKEYVQIQIDAHQKAVALFESYAAAGDNDDLKKWAGDTVPALKEHLKEAQDLRTTVNQTAQADDGKAGNAMARDERSAAATGEDAKKPMRKSNIKYLTRQAPTDWTAEALLGRTVENDNGDNLGEINNVIINEKGDVVAVVIGVGGFLGVGEKNVGVPFDALDFRTVDPAEDRADNARDERAKQKQDSVGARFDTEHENMHIVLNTTKEDLEAAPEFAWLDQQDSDRAQGERERSVE
jgi:putative membrane protein